MVKNKEETSETLVSPGLASSTIIFEQVSQGFYLVFDRETRRYHLFPYKNVPMNVEDRDYVPLARLPWPAVTLPPDFDDPKNLAQTKEEFVKAINEGPPQNVLPSYESEASLFNEIKAFLIDHLDVANDLFYDVYSNFVMATWRSEDFSVVPYAFFLGPLASGKTRALECFQRLCYRSIMASSLSAASLFRVLEAWKATVLLDETEIYNRESMVEVLALLNSGYRRGQYAIRIEKVEQGCPTIAMFDTFGFKVLAGTEELAATLQSRCILTTMSRAVRHVNLFIDEKKAQDLRNKLLLYRFKNLGTNPDFNVSSLNGYFNNSRVIELFVSLLQVAPTEEIRNRLIACMKSITQTRLDEEQASLEARIFDAVLKCENGVENRKISSEAITEAFNQGVAEKEQLKSFQVGRKVAALGFEKCRFGGGKSGFFWDSKHIERLKARYYPAPSNIPSLPSQPSLPSLMTEQTTETNPSLREGSEGSPSESSLSRVHESSVKREGSEQSEGSEGSLEAPLNKASHIRDETEPSHIQDKTAVTLDDFLAYLQYEYEHNGVNQVLAVLPLTPEEKGRCGLCGKSSLPAWQIQLMDGSRYDVVCVDCGGAVLDLMRTCEDRAGKGMNEAIPISTALPTPPAAHINDVSTESSKPNPSFNDQLDLKPLIDSLNTSDSERVCGQCRLWHKRGCSYPDADYSCVNPKNPYAGDCHDFERQKGA